MRAVVSALVTVLTGIWSVALSDAVCSYRTARLSLGISEGLYVALGSKDHAYCWKTLKSRWWWLMAVVLPLTYGPQALQTVLSEVVTTVPFYVKSHSTATIYNYKSYYNATNPSSPPSLQNALGVLSLLGTCNGGGNSILSRNHSVTSSLLRDGFIVATHFVDGDSTNSVVSEEVVMTATSNCSASMINSSSLAHLVTASSQYVHTQQGGTFFSYVYDLHAQVLSHYQLRFNTMSIVANCQQCYHSLMSLQLNAIQSNCTTDVFLSLADVVYTLGNKKVSILATAAQDI